MLDAEAMKVRVRPGSRAILEFGKGLALSVSAGESIGVERVHGRAATALFDALDVAHAAGETALYYEDVYSRMIGAGRLSAELVDVSGLAWCEVDTPDDLAHAERLFAPSL
jgi:choline kinase